MKKVLYFLSGAVFAIIICIAIIYYFLNNKLVRGGSEGSSLITNELVEEKLLDKTIDKIDLIQYEKLVSNKSKTTLVTFWASWCGSCISEIPLLQEYAKKNNIDIVYINFDKENITQLKVVVDKMNKLKINKTYQFLGKKELIDPMNFKMLESFLKEKGIEINNLGLPLTLVYKNGKIDNHFGPIDISNLFNNQLDLIIQK